MAEAAFKDPVTGKLYDSEYREVRGEAGGDVDPVRAALIGAVSAVTDAGRGARMRLNQMGGDVSAYSDRFLEQQESDRLLSGVREQQPVASMIGQAVPYMVVPGAGAGLLRSAVAGAGIGALDPSADPASSMYLGAAVGGAGWAAAAAGRYVKLRGSGAATGADDALAGQFGAVPGGAGAAAGSRADRVRAAIQGEGSRLRQGTGPAGAIDDAVNLDDLNRLGRAQAVDEAGAAMSGATPAALRQANMQQLGYDPSLLGGRAATVQQNQVRQWAAGILDEAGFELTPGQRFGNKQLLQVEASARSTPGLSAPLTAIQDANQYKLNTIVNRALGQEGDVVGLNQIRGAYEGVNEVFERASSAIDARGGVPAGGLGARIQAIVKDMADDGIEVSTAMIDRYKRPNETFSAKGMLAARQALNQRITQAKQSGQTTLIEPYSDMVEAIDGAVQAAARSQSAEIAAAREKLRLLRILERPGVVQGEQHVAPGRMFNEIKRGFRSEIMGTTKRESSPEMARLVRVVRAREAMMREIVGDSGTATRMSLQNLFSSPVETIGKDILGRGAAMAYVQAGKIGQRTLTPQGAEQLAGVWGSTW